MGPIADVISYNTVLLAMTRSGLPHAGEQAERLLRQMTMMTTVVRPNARTYTTVMDAWSRSHNAPRALALLHKMEEVHETTGDVSLRPNCISYSTVINA
jgi:pentatricopeptide repeat protein